MEFLLKRLFIRRQPTMTGNFFTSSAMFFSTVEAAATKSPKSKKKAKSEQTAIQSEPLSENYIIKGGYLLPKPPKRPANPYALYVREKLKSEVGSTLTKDATTFSKYYKDETVDTALKKRLHAEYEVSFKEYELQREEYEKQYSIPKGRLSAWTLFVKEYKSSEELAHKAAERMKEAAKKWSELGETEKKEYEKRALETNEKLSQESERFREKFQIPDDPKRSGYNVFVSEFSKEATNDDTIKASDRIKEASEKWNKLTDQEKDKYVAHAEKQNEKRLVSKENFCHRIGVTTEQLQELEDKYKAARKQVIEELENGQEQKEVKESAGRKKKTTRSASPAASSARKKTTSVKKTETASTTKVRAKSATPRKATATTERKKAATSKSVTRKTKAADDKVKPKRTRAASAGTASKKETRGEIAKAVSKVKKTKTDKK